MPTCGTCRYLGKAIERVDKEFNPLTPVYHVCDLIKHRPDYGDTSQIAYTIDASDYHATLCVKDEFGCNQHAPRT